MSIIQNLRKSLDRNWRPVCSVGGDASSWGRVCPFPLPLPPTSGGDGPVRSRLALLWSFSVPLFCERPAVCSSRLIFSSCYPTVSKSSLQLLSGPWGLVPTLSNATRSSPFRPRLLVADASVWGTFLLGVAFST